MLKVHLILFYLFICFHGCVYTHMCVCFDILVYCVPIIQYTDLCNAAIYWLQMTQRRLHLCFFSPTEYIQNSVPRVFSEQL